MLDTDSAIQIWTKRPPSPANEKSFEIINVGKDLPEVFGKSALKIRLLFVGTQRYFSAFDKVARRETK
jgi:hypothetical protein